MTALLVPGIQRPGFSEETRTLSSQQAPLLLDQSDNADERLAEADRLLQLGIEQVRASQFREALESWEQALEIYREPVVHEAFPQESRAGEGAALGNLGIAYRSLGQ
jgi:tetratricopeptide (TPR) repeat protein